MAKSKPKRRSKAPLLFMALVLSASAPALAQLSDIKGTYTTGECADRSAQIVVKEDRVMGPDFRCSLGELKPGVGTGMAAFEAECSTKHGQAKRGLFVLDFSMDPEISMSVPGINARYKAEEWIKITRC